MSTPQRSSLLSAALLIATLGVGCSNDVDTKLSSELSAASLKPVEWPPLPGSKVPSPVQTAETACALRLRDDRTGNEFWIQRSTKTRLPSVAGDTTSRWEEYGDYTIVRPGEKARAPSHYIRIACGTWKIVGLVERGA